MHTDQSLHRDVIDESITETSETNIKVHVEAWETENLVGVTTATYSNIPGHIRLLSQTIVTGKTWDELQ